MAVPSCHVSNIEAARYITRSPSPPVIIRPLDWKTPSLRERKRRGSPLLAEEESTSTDDVLSTPFTWKRPALASRRSDIQATDPSTDTEFGEEQVLNFTKTHPRLTVIEQETAPSSSSSSTLDVNDDGNYELESILLDEEEFSIPSYNRHRSKTGIDMLDEYLAAESNEIVEEDIDAVGLASGSTLEISGPPASGKTTLLLQMAVLERLHSLQRCQGILRRKNVAEEDDELYGANEAATQVVLIDTEGSIGLDCIARVASKCILEDNPSLSTTSKLRLQRILLAGIHYCRCTSDYELIALLRTLLPKERRHASSQIGSSQTFSKETRFISSSSLPIRTSMIIIDSISYHLRAPMASELPHLVRQRSRLMEEMRIFCTRCSHRGIKIIFSNQMRMVFRDKNGYETDIENKDAEGYLFPLLKHKNNGSILGNHVWRLVLFRDGRQDSNKEHRFAYVLSRPTRIGEGMRRGGDKIDWNKWMPVALDCGMLRTC